MEKQNNYLTPPAPETADPFRVTLCSDGVYRWIYEFKMYRNPSILFTVYGVMFVAAAIVALLVFLINLISGNVGWPPFKDFDWDSSKYAIIVLGVLIFVLPFVAYLIICKLYGGKYMMLFEMDEHAISSNQMEKTFEKGQAISWVTGFLGALSGNLSVTGLSIANASRQSMISRFSQVKRIIPKKGRDLIKVNNRFKRNQIYVCKEDFDFVLKYLQEKTVSR